MTTRTELRGRSITDRSGKTWEIIGLRGNFAISIDDHTDAIVNIHLKEAKAAEDGAQKAGLITFDSERSTCPDHTAWNTHEHHDGTAHENPTVIRPVSWLVDDQTIFTDEDPTASIVVFEPAISLEQLFQDDDFEEFRVAANG